MRVVIALRVTVLGMLFFGVGRKPAATVKR